MAAVSDDAGSLSGFERKCACGSATLEVFIRRDPNGAIVSCWVKLDSEGYGHPGCAPDERTADVIERRNMRVRGDYPKPRPVYPRSARVRCCCGRLTLVSTSNLDAIREAPLVDDPPDPSVPVGPTACWLAISADDGREEGCTPDFRTYDVLERRVPGYKRPANAVDLEPIRPVLISDADRAAFTALQITAAPPVERKSRTGRKRGHLAVVPTPEPIAQAAAPVAAALPAPAPAPEEPAPLTLFG